MMAVRPHGKWRRELDRQAYPTAQLYRVATTRDIPYHVCAAQQDQSAICVPSSQLPWRSTSPYLGTGIRRLAGRSMRREGVNSE